MREMGLSHKILPMKFNTTSVLVIEPHPMMRESLCAAIDAEPDFSVVEASAGAANTFTLRVSSQHDLLFLVKKPDIILWALGNPGLEDLQALEQLQKKWRSTPILALTRDEVPGQEQAALAHGASAVLTKASSRSKLLEVLRALHPSSSSTYSGEKIMIKSLRSKKEKGQGMVEYALILVLVAVVVIAALVVMGPRIEIIFARINSAIYSGGATCTTGNFYVISSPGRINSWVTGGYFTLSGSVGTLADGKEFACGH